MCVFNVCHISARAGFFNLLLHSSKSRPLTPLVACSEFQSRSPRVGIIIFTEASRKRLCYLSIYRSSLAPISRRQYVGECTVATAAREKRLFITASPINIRRSLPRPPPSRFTHSIDADNYGSLQEIINSSASLSPNEATCIGPGADGDVVRLIAALLSCVRRSSRRCPGISSYGYARQHYVRRPGVVGSRNERFSRPRVYLLLQRNEKEKARKTYVRKAGSIINTQRKKQK